MLNLIKSRIMQRFWFAILGVLGFSACDNPPLDMYGSPTVDFMVKGKVTDSEGTPIKGIVISSKRVQSYNVGEGINAVTDENGDFVTNQIHQTGFYGTLVFTDVDGADNGGDFATCERDLSALPKTLVKNGDGWYKGEYEVTADVKLNKK